MSAQIINLAEARERLAKKQSSATAGDNQTGPCDKAPEFLFWTGASGCRFVHTVHSIYCCPELPASNYILVRKHPSGRGREAVAIGQLDNECSSMNLAEVRQRAAELDATEIHVHLLATSPENRKQIATDLRTAQFGVRRTAH